MTGPNDRDVWYDFDHDDEPYFIDGGVPYSPYFMPGGVSLRRHTGYEVHYTEPQPIRKYILVWRCEYCGSDNPVTDFKCGSCGGNRRDAAERAVWLE